MRPIGNKRGSSSSLSRAFTKMAPARACIVPWGLSLAPARDWGFPTPSADPQPSSWGPNHLNLSVSQGRSSRPFRYAAAKALGQIRPLILGKVLAGMAVNIAVAAGTLPHRRSVLHRNL